MNRPVQVLTTERLSLRWLSLDDADFIIRLLNQPSFIRHIGDRGVRTADDARRYIEHGPLHSYREHGYGLYLVELKADAMPIGICGLVKRDTLPDADIGFAFLPEHWSRGYAREAATAVLDYAGEVLGLKRLLAITSPDNDASGKLLGKLGFKYVRLIRLADKDDEVKLFSTDGT